MAVIIDGKTLRDKILDELRAKTSLLNAKPSLSVIIVGDDPASKIYVNTKKKKALEIGFRSEIIEFDKDVAESVLLDKINQLNSDKNVNAILVQLPLPAHIDTKKVIETIDPIKDVDCFHPYNAGKIFTNSDTALYPCTPKGIIRLLEEYNVDVQGKNVVIVGRSNIVGRPLAAMLTNLNATVTLCHSKTDNISYYTKNADIVISAAGCAGLIKADMLKEGVIVVDVGMNRIETSEENKLVGDVDFEDVEKIASLITPVPGGVGPMTICSLMVMETSRLK